MFSLENNRSLLKGMRSFSLFLLHHGGTFNVQASLGQQKRPEQLPTVLKQKMEQ